MIMPSQLSISVGQFSDKGRKEINQDFHGSCLPAEPLLGTKGFAAAIADGISSSQVSQIASQTAVRAVLEDYYCTPDAWSVKTSIERVMVATNSWLHAQTRQSRHAYDHDRGYVCTLSALVIKSTTAHLFHVGDARVCQVRHNSLEQLTNEHRVALSAGQSYLGRAMGVNPQLEIDYRTWQVEAGDLFLLATDGVYEYADAAFITSVIREHGADLDLAARRIAEQAYRQGSPDNLSVQIVRVDALPAPQANEIWQQLSTLPLPPDLQPRMSFDGYRIIREIHASSRSHVYLATDAGTEERVAIKTPSVDLHGDPAYLERFLMEEWIARRINSAHVLKPCAQPRKRQSLYVAMEYVDGQTLTQWMTDHPRAELESVRGMIEQIARGLRAFHRLEMLHQDLRPDNIMIDTTGTVKIIDFGSTRVAGMMDVELPVARGHLLGTTQYAAPEYFLGEAGTSRSDQFSLGVIAYQMLTGRLPYGAEVSRSRTVAAQRKLVYRPVDAERAIPHWVDEAIRKAVHPDPRKRYDDVAEFVYDLHHPNKAFLHQPRTPLIERNPVVFWKCVSFVLLIALVLSLAMRSAPA